MKHAAIRLCVCAPLLCLLNTFASAEDAPHAHVSPERLQSALHKVEDLANETLRTGIPGIAIAVVHHDHVVYLRGFGVREAGKPARIDADTVFQLASVSKPITSTVLAAIVGEGRIGWDDRVIDHDPGFRMFDPFVTHELRLRDLLCHRSGLPDHWGDLIEDLGYGRDEVLRRARFQPPASSFRTHYAYTNFGYSEAAYAVAKASRKSWENLAASKLFGPLGMTSTSFRFADYANAKNRALVHVLVDGNWIAKNTRQPDAQAPAGGASSTLNDLIRWMRLQLNESKLDGRQLISASALAETHTPQMLLSFSPEQGRLGSYGLGWNVSIERGGRAFWKHSGSFSLGMRTEVALLPSEKLGIVVLSNAGPTGVPEGLVESFYDLVLDDKLQRDWMEFANRMMQEEIKTELGQVRDYTHPPTDPMPSLALTAYTGKYANQLFGPIELVEEQGKLILRIGPKPMVFELRHYDRDVFLYQPVGESAGGVSGVCFSIDPTRQADRVLIENLNIHGQGTFSRVKAAPNPSAH